MNDLFFDVLIVGAGHAGAQAATTLRAKHYGGSIALVGDELELPYERPPLSKDYLLKEKEFERILIKPGQYWTDKNVKMLLGRTVERVFPDKHHVQLSDGTYISYGKLIWATGGRARPLPCPGAEMRGVHTIRTRADIDRLMDELELSRHVVIVGGGYIGLEAAAALSKYNVQVTVLEAMDRVLARVAGEPLSRFFESEHRRNGVDIRLNVAVEAIQGTDGRVGGVLLKSGELIKADLVIVGIGIIPATGPLQEAGASGTNGVSVDDYCRTSLPDIYAIGDCAQHVNIFAAGLALRLESVQNANDQANVAANSILGKPEPYSAVPWFWSNQYDLKLQTVGLSLNHDQVVTRGSIESRSFSIIYLRDEKVIALDCVNSVKDYVQGKQWVVGELTATQSQLADTSISLKELATACAADATSDK